MAPDGEAAHLVGTVALVERLGGSSVVHVDTPAGLVVLQGDGDLPLALDERVGLAFDPERLHLFGEDGRALG